MGAQRQHGLVRLTHNIRTYCDDASRLIRATLPTRYLPAPLAKCEWLESWLKAP